MKYNLKKHEIIGLFMLFLSGTLLGLGLFVIMWGANRPLFYGNLEELIKGNEFLVFPLFFGLGFVLYALGNIELREALPGRRK